MTKKKLHWSVWVEDISKRSLKARGRRPRLIRTDPGSLTQDVWLRAISAVAALAFERRWIRLKRHSRGVRAGASITAAARRRPQRTTHATHLPPRTQGAGGRQLLPPRKPWSCSAALKLRAELQVAQKGGDHQHAWRKLTGAQSRSCLRGDSFFRDPCMSRLRCTLRFGQQSSLIHHLADDVC